MSGQRIGPRRSAGSAHGFANLRATGALPTDVVQGATGRIEVFALFVAAVAVYHAGLKLWLFAENPENIVPLQVAQLVAMLVVLVASGGVALGVRRMRLTADQVFRFGASFLAIVVLVASLLRFSQPGGIPLGWSVGGVLIALFPVIVPCPPRRALLAAGVSVGAAFVGYLVVRLAGLTALGAYDTVRAFQGEILGTLLGVVSSDVVYGLGRKLYNERQLGSYELIDRLGAGGMGEVWRAKHGMLARPAAVKLIRPEALARNAQDVRESLVARFEREAQAASALGSPHTIEVYDFGVADDGTFYIVMELLDGIDLHELVKKYGPVPPERAVTILRQACKSLGEAHHKGMVHRDIKPANVVLCRLGDEVDFVKVLDFGLVSAPAIGDEDEKLTMDGSLTGTPAFMAPEQASGEGVIDGRADLYALGCVAYWLLTGGFVFDGTSPMDFVIRTVRDDPRPPSEKSGYPLPEALDALVLQLLAKDPARRPADAAEVMKLLDAVPVAERWTEVRAALWWLREGPPPRPTP